jgi:hypothetical protein
MYFNIQKHCDTHPHTVDIHCDASETHWGLVNLHSGHTESGTCDYEAPIYVKEIEAFFYAIQHVLLINRQHHNNVVFNIFTDNVYHLFNRGHGSLKYINNEQLINIILFYTFLKNFLFINLFYVPSEYNCSDYLTRPNGWAFRVKDRVTIVFDNYILDALSVIHLLENLRHFGFHN